MPLGFWEIYEMYLTKPMLFVEHWWQHSLMVVLFLSGAFLVIESVLPKKKNYYVLTRKGFVVDLVYIFVYDFLLTFLVVYGLDELLSEVMGGVIIYDLTQHSWLLLFPVIFILNDFVNWLGHLLLHKVPFLWKFHKIHHAQEELGFASTRHFHFMEYLVFRPLMYIPFHFLGVPPLEYFVIQIWMSYTFTFLSHANIKVNWGFINYIFITPETHYWHHARNVKSKHSVNYASILTIWDQLFGYFYLPKDEKEQPELGLYDDDTPDGFLKQQIHPFKTLGKKEKFENFKTKK